MQLNPLGGQSPNPKAAATFGQIKQILEACEGPMVGFGQPLVNLIRERLPAYLQNRVGPALFTPGGSTYQQLPYVMTYHIFSALSQGAPAPAVLEQALRLRAAYVTLVPMTLVQAALQALQEWASDRVAGSPPGMPILDDRDAVRAAILGAVPDPSAIREALASAGAVEPLSHGNSRAFTAIVPQGVRALYRATDLQREDRYDDVRHVSYARLCALAIGAPMTQGAWLALKSSNAAGAAAWERDPSFDASALVQVDADGQKPEGLLALEAEIDAGLMGTGNHLREEVARASAAAKKWGA